MARRGKKYREVVGKIDREKRYSFQEAVETALSGAYKKFDETLKNLSKARDEGQMDGLLAGLGAMMAYCQTQECKVEEETGQPSNAC